MRKSYKNPLVWSAVVAGLLVAALGQGITMMLHASDWALLFYNFVPGGLFIAALFSACALANYIGSHFCVERNFPNWLPSRIVLFDALIAFVILGTAMVFGIEHRWAVWLLCGGTAALVLSVPVAFFIRGMAMPTEYDS